MTTPLDAPSALADTETGVGWRGRRADPEPAAGEVAEQLDDAPGLVPPEGARTPPVGVPDPGVVTRVSAPVDGDGDDQPRAGVIPEGDAVSTLDEAGCDLHRAAADWPEVPGRAQLPERLVGPPLPGERETPHAAESIDRESGPGIGAEPGVALEDGPTGRRAERRPECGRTRKASQERSGQCDGIALPALGYRAGFPRNEEDAPPPQLRERVVQRLRERAGRVRHAPVRHGPAPVWIIRHSVSSDGRPAARTPRPRPSSM